MADRFDLEQQILNCWSIIDDLTLLAESDLSEENRKIFIKGLIVKYELKFDKMFNTFEDCIKDRVFNKPTEFNGLETAYDDPYDILLQDLNDGYYPES